MLALYFCFTSHAGAEENPHVASIHNYCVKQSTPQIQTDLSRMLDEIQEKYQHAENRSKYRKLYVAALDEIILNSEFAEILDCREKVHQHGFVYRLAFLEPENDSPMQVRVNNIPGLNRAVTLMFSLVKSVQAALFIYLHELVHVCQTIERLAARAGDFDRLAIFGEIEAFYKMTLAYRSFVPTSPGLCRSVHKDMKGTWVQHPLYESYLSAERSLEAGSFSQGIVKDYIGHYRKDEIVMADSPEHDYAHGDFKLNSLRPELISLIQRLKIKVIEP